jgi:hypothetical protein
MKKSTTAVIVNDRGEVFTHWASGCTISASGYETYYLIPQFAKTRTITIGEWDFIPSSLLFSKRRHFTINKPHLFSSVRSAETCLRKIVRHYGRRCAIVT